MDSKNKCIQTHIHWIATFGAFILMTQTGILVGWTAPNISKLTANDSAISLNNDQVSWIVSLTPLGATAGSIIGSIVCLEFFGGRLSILISLVFLIISWICMILANSVIWLYIGRGLGGVATGMSISSFSIYLGEVADPEIRGRLIVMAAGGISFGTIIGTIAEYSMPMKVSSSIYLTKCVFTFILFLWLKDSPYYLMKKMKYGLAKKSIQFYHANCDVEYEVNQVKNFIETHASSGFLDKIRDLVSPVVRKSLFIILILFILPHLSGFMIITSYMEVIMKSAQSSLVKSEYFVIYANITNVTANLLTFKLVDKLGRRIILVISCIGTSTFMLALGAHFSLLRNGAEAKSLEWLPVACVLGYLISYAIGYSTVPSVVLSELFTDNVKSIASLLGSVAASLVSFILTKSYLPLVAYIGEAWVFWIYAIFSLTTIPFTIFLLPETKGKTFQQIQNDLMKK